MANIITGCRFACSLALLFFPALSPGFFVLYLTAGITDMVDGTVARKTNTVSEFGAKLDTAADLLFTMVCLEKLLPVMELPSWLWIWVGAIGAIKVANVAAGWIIRKKFTAEHTLMNKLAGALLFLLPLTLSVIELRCSAAAVCTVAAWAALQEGYIIWTGNGSHMQCTPFRSRKESVPPAGPRRGKRRHL